ncbi:MAG: Hsp20/alpha crystallin family protein [Pseudomonadota bacterium]
MNIVRRTGSPLSTYRPGAIEDQFGRMVEDMFDNFFAPLATGGGISRMAGDGVGSPRLNITEDENAFEVQAEMPGVKKEDIKVAIDGQRVTLEGESKREDAQREGEQLVYAERSVRKFTRSFMLPTEVDDAGAQARLEDGVLKLTLPKKQGSEAKRITIQ